MSTPDPTMNRVALRKAAELLGIGYRVNGVAIRNDQTGQQGFVTDGGMVGWWRPENDAQTVKAQRDELAKDAERYRWLRDSHDIDDVFKEVKDPGRWELPYVVLMRGVELDAAIDAAIAKVEGKEGGAA